MCSNWDTSGENNVLLHKFFLLDHVLITDNWVIDFEFYEIFPIVYNANVHYVRGMLYQSF